MKSNRAEQIYEMYELGPEYEEYERGYFQKRWDVIKSYFKEILRFVPKFF
jgi:hypothetical protein